MMDGRHTFNVECLIHFFIGCTASFDEKNMLVQGARYEIREAFEHSNRESR